MFCKNVWSRLEQIGILMVISSFLLNAVIQGVDGCRNLVFKPPMDGRYLNGHVKKTFEIQSKGDCELKCYLDDECMSTNVRILSTGKYLCELSDSDHELHPQDLKFREQFSYTATENFSVNSLCSSNSRCQTGFSDRGYRCVCSTGFKGENCDIVILGQDSTKPGNSCKHILESGSSLGDGEYWIHPGNKGEPFKAHCDMKTDGGGWLLIANIVADSSAPFFDDWALETSYRQISEYGNNNLRLAQRGLKELRTQVNFTQLRFHCKKQRGRTFHVTTAPNNTGEAVVQYFSGQTDVMPDSCGSFQRMDDDNSFLSVNCLLWGNDNGDHSVGKWGHYNKEKKRRMYDRAAFVALRSLWLIGANKQLCDDNNNDMPLSPGDFWKVYVR